MRSQVTALIGGQYGSEGKGQVVSRIAHDYDVHVRVGGPQAGHTLYHEGARYVQRSLPCGWVNPNAILVIGRGAVIDLDVLMAEIQACPDPEVTGRLYIDNHAWILSPHDRQQEGGRDGQLNQSIGSTGEGVGAARLRRLQRDADDNWLAWNVIRFERPALVPLLCDTVELLHREIGMGRRVLLEGAQGSGLSLIHGDWPYVTSHDTSAAQLVADCGIPARSLTDVMLVARTFPIRVAGNSGPLHQEITWPDLSQALGIEISEQTTVTRRTRRIGRWDPALFRRSCVLNRPTQVVFTFADYLHQDVQAGSKPDTWPEAVHAWLRAAIGVLRSVEPGWAGDVWVSTGPRPQDMILLLPAGFHDVVGSDPLGDFTSLVLRPGVD